MLTSPAVEGVGHYAADLRVRNLREVVAVLLQEPDGLTQAELSERTGLGRTTISGLLHECPSLAPVAVAPRGPLRRGRPAERWSVGEDAAFAIGVDIGRTHVGVCILDAFGEVVDQDRRPIPVDHAPAETLRDARRLVRERSGAIGATADSVAGFGVGLPAVVARVRATDPDGAQTDHVTQDGSPWAAVDLEAAVQSAWPGDGPVPAVIDNDANLAALGESSVGAGADSGSALVVKWSAGVGAGLVIEGRLWRGARGAAAELGHLKVAVVEAERHVLRLGPVGDWAPCPRCGQIDCLDVLVGAPALARAAGTDDILRDLDGDDGRARARAEAVLAVAGTLLGRALGQALTVADPACVVIGGQIGGGAYRYVESHVREGIGQTASPLLRSSTDLRRSALGQNAVARGAAMAVVERFVLDHLSAG